MPDDRDDPAKLIRDALGIVSGEGEVAMRLLEVMTIQF